MAERGDGIAGVLRRLVYRVHFVLASAFGGIVFVLISLAAFLVAVAGFPEAGVMVFVRAWGAIMMFVLGWRIDLEGFSIFESTSPAVVIANHQSALDTATWGSFFPRGNVAVGKKEIAKIPFFGWLWRATNNILVDRKNPQSARESLALAARRIRDEKLTVWILPEGHRGQGAEMLPFKKGAFHLAIAAQVPVIPMATEPMGTVLDASRWMARPGTIRIRVLPPIPTAGMTEKDVEKLLQTSREALDRVRRDLTATARTRIG
jgi:1-acyl-sn-glycerol-3-phosphate acyltransferase